MLKESKYIALFLLLALACSMVGCAGYQRGMQRYDGLMDRGDYKQAYQALEHFKFLQKNRNQFLYYAEKGRVAQLLRKPDTSNYFLNQADAILEATWKSTGDAVIGNLINPMQERYMAEDMERMMLHYCKAMNYLVTGDQAGALVEARRISLQANRLIDTKTKGTRDALSFGYWIQGVIYEAGNDLNNAFIAYRNAADLWLGNKNKDDQMVQVPGEIMIDVVRTAFQLGYTDQLHRYANYVKNLPESSKSGGGTLLIFHEIGNAPALQNNFFSFNSWAPGGDNIYFNDSYNRYQIPVQSTAFSGFSNSVTPSLLKGLRVAVAVPEPGGVPAYNGNIRMGETSFSFNKMQDMYQWAARPDAMSRELQKAVIRALVKKGTELAAQAGAKAIAKSGDKKDSDSNKKEDADKKEAQAVAIAQGVGLLINVLNQSTEVADTRSWRSLPGAVYAARIPLQPGTNSFTIQEGNSTKTITIEGKGGLQVMRW
jgi:hypothetical protein